MLVGALGEQPGAQRHLSGQVELVRPGPRHGLAERTGLEGLLGQQPGNLVHVEYPLVRLAVGDRVDGAQHLVPLDHVAQGGLDDVRVDRPAEQDGSGDVVCRGASFELSDEPEPALPVRHGYPLGARAGGQPRPGIVHFGQLGEQAGRRRRLEQHPDLELNAEQRTDAADEPHGEQ
jgi:hypothetical protein